MRPPGSQRTGPVTEEKAFVTEGARGWLLGLGENCVHCIQFQGAGFQTLGEGVPQIFGECQLASAVAATLIIPRRQSGEGEGFYQEVGRRGQE